jgi:hypothetical protein
MPIYLMDKAYRITTSGGVAANRVVVQGNAAGECALPGSSNAPGILGVTVHSQGTSGRNVSVRKAGIAEVVASGAITVGAPVNIAGSTGKVKAVTESTGTKVNCIGFAETPASADGDIIEVFLSIHERTAP